ncbi:MAG: phage terminase small subunit P27 family [Planctomycetes bacterium]|nr:phage terminase small subunit P27 family [Planctomycetota bacterium]
MAPGPYPKPRALRLAGSTRGKPAPKTTGLTPGSAEPPEHLTDCAKEFWRRVAPALVQSGVFMAIDEPALEATAETYSVMRAAADALRENGITYATAELRKSNPANAIFSQAASLYLQLAGHFGLTSLSRQRLDLPVTPARDMLAEFLNRNTINNYLTETASKNPTPKGS